MTDGEAGADSSGAGNRTARRIGGTILQGLVPMILAGTIHASETPRISRAATCAMQFVARHSGTAVKLFNTPRPDKR